jgi:glycosyltransferase involved in cell wall biosynthesis
MGYNCECAYLHPPADPGFAVLAERARECEAPLVSVPDRGPFDWKVIQQLIQICRTKRVAVWHAHEYKSNVLGLIVRRFWPMKLVTTVHGWGVHEGRAPFYNGIDRRCLRFYQQVICVSNNLLMECCRYGVQSDRCQLIHNAIDTEQFQRTLSHADAKSSLSAPQQGLLLGAMGRLSSEKGFDLLIGAVARLVAMGHDIHLWIAGEGPERSRLEAEIARRGLGNRVRLLGMVSDPRVFLQAIDVFVLSSVREGLPNVVLEAMAMESPVVATRIAGVPGLLNDGEFGLLVKPGSVECLADGIDRLASNPELRARLACSARRRIEQSYSFERRMTRIAAIYDHLLGRDAAAAKESHRLSA